MTIKQIDLSTNYLGLRLKSPVVVSSCPLTSELDVLRRIESAGAGAAVLPSLFEEQIEAAAGTALPTGMFHYEESKEGAHYFRELKDYNRGPQFYAQYLRDAKKAVSIPIIASLNGTHDGAWVRYASELQEAGADALELNLYFVVADPTVTSDEVEARYLKLVTAARKAVSIPLAVKVGPHFTSFANMARRLADAGADGLVLFNRFMQPDIDARTLSVAPHVSLSAHEEMRLPLRWIAILRGQLSVSLAANGGIHEPIDVVKALLAGADVAMVASTLYRHGTTHLTTITTGLRHWFESRDYDSVAQIQGLVSQAKCQDPSAFERANYARVVSTYSRE